MWNADPPPSIFVLLQYSSDKSKVVTDRFFMTLRARQSEVIRHFAQSTAPASRPQHRIASTLSTIEEVTQRIASSPFVAELLLSADVGLFITSKDC
jgi:hypothetical protein